MFKLPTNERLSRWKSFRASLDDLPLGEAVRQTNDFWHSCPFIPFYLDESVENWPDPWQLIEENYYCELAKALGIVYTLHLSKHQQNLDPEIRIYYDEKTKYTYHIVYLCDGKYVLNMVEGEVVNKDLIDKELILKHRYTAEDMKLEKY